jgi:hypothetical protein
MFSSLSRWMRRYIRLHFGKRIETLTAAGEKLQQLQQKLFAGCNGRLREGRA